MRESRLFASDLFITPPPLHPRPHTRPPPPRSSYSGLLKRGYINDVPVEPALGRLSGRQKKIFVTRSIIQKTT